MKHSILFNSLTFGTSGNDTGVLLSSGIPNAVLWADMELLFNLTTVLNPLMEDVADEFIDEFKINSSNSSEYFNNDYMNHVIAHPTLRNYIKNFGNSLNTELINNGGDINNIGVITLPQSQRLKFNTLYDRLNGFQILMNDTEKADISKIWFTFDQSTGEWEGSFFIDVTDHFGLDKADVIKYQHKPFASGFAAWWRLQHMRGFVPFKTKVWIKTQIKGKI